VGIQVGLAGIGVPGSVSIGCKAQPSRVRQSLLRRLPLPAGLLQRVSAPVVASVWPARTLRKVDLPAPKFESAPHYASREATLATC